MTVIMHFIYGTERHNAELQYKTQKRRRNNREHSDKL